MYWTVIYKAIGDFSQLRRDAAEATSDLKAMQDAVKAESAAEVTGATQAAAARQKDIASIQAESQALSQLANSAKQTNVQLLYGGRSDMSQHLADMAQELNYTTLLNRQKWLGFSSVQQAMSYRQQMYNLALLENKAHFAGYLTADQYLGFLQRETMQTAALSAAIRDRTSTISAETTALLAHANALMGTHQTVGALGEQLASASAFAAAITGVPTSVTTRVTLDDAQAMSQLAAWRAALAGLPGAENTDITAVATRLGGIPLAGPAERVPVTLTPVLERAGAQPAVTQMAELLQRYARQQQAQAPPVGAAAEQADALSEALAALPARDEAAAASLGRFADSAALAAVDVRALEQGIDRLAAAGQLMSEVKKRSDEWFQLWDVMHAVDSEELSAVPVSRPLAEEAAQVKALTDDLKVLEGKVIESHVVLDGGPEAIAEAAELDAVVTDLPEEKHTILYVDGTEAIPALEEFTRLWEDIPHTEEVQAKFDAAEATSEEGKFVNGLIEASKQKYEFEATLDDAEALAELDTLRGKELSATEQGKALLALLGQGGASGGGGGGGPPKPPAPPGASAPGEPDPADAAAWNMLADAMARAGASAKTSAAASKDAGAAATTAGAAARGAGGWWGFWTRDLKLFGGAFAGIPLVATISVWALALHTLIDFFIVLVPAVIAASVALGAFAVAAEPATKDIIAHLTGVHTALDALGTGADNLGTAHFGPLQAQAGSLNAAMTRLPVTIRTLQSAMAPTVITIFGAAISTLTGHMGLLQSITQKAGTWVEDMVIKVQQAVSSHSDMLGPLIATATNDMHILGSIGTSILRILGLFLQAGQMTHVSELLFEGIAYTLSVLQKALNAVGPYALAAGIALFAFVHYGGLVGSMLVTVVNQLEFFSLMLVTVGSKLPLVGGAFEALSTQMKAAFAVLTPGAILAIAAAIAAVGYAIYSAGQASSQAKAYVGGLVSSLTSDNASAGFAQIQTNLASMGRWLSQASASQRNFVGNMAQGWSNLTKDASGFGLHLQAFKDLWEAVTGTNQQPGSTALVLKQMTAEQQQWTTTLETAAATTKRYGTTVQQSFALMDLAGVKVTDDLSTQLTKVNDLVTGWLNMGVAGYNLKNGMNQLGAAVDSVTLASEIQNSQITALTGDFTSFLTLVDAGQTSFETYAQGLLTVGTNSKVTGASMSGLNAASLTLRQSWEGNLTAGQTLYNNLLLQNAAAGNNAKSNAALAASGKDIVNSLLAQGGATTESVQGAYALAQTMGYTGKATYDALLKWSGGNLTLKGTTADLNKQVGLLETGSSNLASDVLNLAGAISTNLNQAIANGLVNMPAMTKAVAGFYQYVLAHRADLAKGITPQEVSLSAQVANALIAVYGTSPQGLSQAKDEFLATLSEMGVKRSQALALWAKDVTPVNVKVNSAQAEAALLKVHDDAVRDLGSVPPITPPPSWLAQVRHDIASFFTTDVVHWSAVGWSAVYNGFDNDVWHKIGDFFNKAVPGWFTQFGQQWAQHASTDWQQFNSSVVSPMGKFFTSVIPGWFTQYGQQWAKAAVNDWQQFSANVVTPFTRFFTVLIPGWFAAYAQSWQQHWVQGWQAFSTTILQPLAKLFTSTIPGWFAGYASSWTQHWNQAWSAFNGTILGPMERLFTSQIPSWWDSLSAKWNGFWSQAWTYVNNDVFKPIEGFFTSTLPNAMRNSLVGGINVVIGDLNTVIGWINSVTSVVGVHIGSIPKLARGGAVPMASGSVPGTGDEDGTHIIAMGGEFMLRKPARMALQAEFGPDFLDHLNQADTWLGSGSRGNTASQRGSGHGRYASGGGILGDVTNWIGDAAGAVKGAAGAVWNGITGAASDVAKWGEQAVFNAMWSATGAPAEKALEGLGTPGDMGAAWLQDVHNGVETWMTGQTAKAQASAAASTPAAGGGGGLIAAIMKGMAAARGWIGAQWNALYDVEEAEAGFNLTAQNPTSDAYGLAQFIGGAGEYAQYGGNSTTASGQITAMLNYIAQRYGSPAAAWDHEEAYHWYAGGGPVIAAIEGAVSSKNEQDALALGAWLFTRLNPGTGSSGGEYGAWLINLAKHKGWTQAQAQNPSQAVRLVAPAYAAGVRGSTPTAWKDAPSTAALRAVQAASTTLGTRWSGNPSAATLAAGWKTISGYLGPSSSPPQSTSQAPSGDVAAYQAAAGRLYPDWEGALNPWKTLNTWTKQPSGVSAADWKAWLGLRSTIENRVSVAGSYIAPLFDDLKVNPQELTPAMWSAANSNVRRWQAAMDLATLAKAREPALYSPIQSNLTKFQTDVVDAANAWHNVWGTTLTPTPGSGGSTGGGSTGGGGGVGTPGAGTPGPGGVGVSSIDLSRLIVGGPAVAAVGNLGFGIASGGEVPTLSNVAAMFGGGMAAGGMVPELFVPGLSASLARQLSAASSRETPRTMAEAAAVNRTGLHVDQLTIHNPVREETHQSIARTSNRLAFLAGRGIA